MDKLLAIYIVSYFPFLFSFLTSFTLLLLINSKVKNKKISIKNGKYNYTIYVVIIGIFSATLLFGVLMAVFHVYGGHGFFVYIVFPIFHILLSSTLILLGRIIIGWENIQY